MFTHTRFTRYTAGSDIVGQANDAVSGDGEASFAGTAAKNATTEIDLAFPYAKVKSLVIYAEGGGITLNSNAADGSGGDSLEIPAGLTTWNQNDLAVCPFTIDVTALYAVNASATVDVTLSVRVLLDVTP
jgi:hypothetical protein